MTSIRKALGKSTLEVGRIGLGCMGMSEFYGGSRDEAVHIHIQTLHAAVEPLRHLSWRNTPFAAGSRRSGVPVVKPADAR